MFIEAMGLYRTLDLKSNPMDSSHFENNFKRAINCPVTRTTMNEPSKQGTYWHYHCLWHTLLNNGEVIITTSRLLLRNQRHRATIMPAKMRTNGNSVTQASNGFIQSE